MVERVKPGEKVVSLKVAFTGQELPQRVNVILSQNNEPSTNHLDPLSLYVSERTRELEFRIRHLQNLLDKGPIKPSGRRRKSREIRQLRDPQRISSLYQRLGELKEELLVFKGYTSSTIWIEQEENVIVGHSIRSK